jgi:hypothetical protein
MDKGHKVVLVRPGVKAPYCRDWPHRTHTVAEVERYIGELSFNWGIKLSTLLVVDRDGPSRAAYDWLRSNRVHRSVMEVLTKKGSHAYFRLPEHAAVRARIRHMDLPLDLLSGPRFALGPGSVIAETGHTYTLRPGRQIVPRAELPVFPVEILQDERKETTVTPLHSPLVSSLPMGNGKITDLAAYLRRIPSVQGQNGSKGLMRACFVVLDQCLDAVSALAYLEGWNTECATPMWDRDSILRCYENCIRKRQGS